MNKNLFGIKLAFKIAVEFVSCEATNRLLQSFEIGTNKDQIKNQKPIANTNLKQTIPIHLSISSFDPLVEESPGFIAPEAIIQNYEENKAPEFKISPNIIKKGGFL